MIGERLENNLGQPEEQGPPEKKKTTGTEVLETEKSIREKEESLPISERFGLQRDRLMDHYLRAYEQFPNADRDPNILKAAISELIEAKRLFEPTKKDEREYNKPGFADDALENTTRGWKANTIKEIMRRLRMLEKIDGPKEKEK
ncbi:hypothetical protein KKC00_02705 [Patescibacteria group bacterium]|nr:hypothetical protein [Patescibacteria group bacterium]